jgi:hypothetical protein
MKKLLLFTSILMAFTASARELQHQSNEIVIPKGQVRKTQEVPSETALMFSENRFFAIDGKESHPISAHNIKGFPTVISESMLHGFLDAGNLLLLGRPYAKDFTITAKCFLLGGMFSPGGRPLAPQDDRLVRQHLMKLSQQKKQQAMMVGGMQGGIFMSEATQYETEARMGGGSLYAQAAQELFAKRKAAAAGRRKKEMDELEEEKRELRDLDRAEELRRDIREREKRLSGKSGARPGVGSGGAKPAGAPIRRFVDLVGDLPTHIENGSLYLDARGLPMGTMVFDERTGRGEGIHPMEGYPFSFRLVVERR